MMNVNINIDRELGKRNPMIYGHFIEHFHRQIYDGIFCPGSPLADKNGFRQDVIEALRKITPPIIRWPGGCFVSSYHWRDGVGERKPLFDKAWRVEDPNTFGTDEFIAFCQELGSEPYICTNAGTGTAEEMSDWVEYCNLPFEGANAKQRISNGHRQPHAVKYWSIGNENYGAWEIGAKTAHEWSLLVTESAKMMKRVDPSIELSAAALPDVEWNLRLLTNAGMYLDWISIHEYWDAIQQTNELATYEQTMAYTNRLDHSIRKVEGMLEATGYADHIKISFDEWNLRGWFHPNSHTQTVPSDKSLYITPRDKNDLNASYTMADAVFTACFLNTLLRHCNTVQMANFAPTVNARGMIYTHTEGIVKRSTYHVFDLYVNYMGDTVIDTWIDMPEKFKVQDKQGATLEIDMVDIVATKRKDGKIAIALINKNPDKEVEICFSALGRQMPESIIRYSVTGNGVDDYNDVNRPDNISIDIDEVPGESIQNDKIILKASPHSVNVFVW